MEPFHLPGDMAFMVLQHRSKPEGAEWADVLANVPTSEWLLLCSRGSVLAELTRSLSREEETVYKLY